MFHKRINSNFPMLIDQRGHGYARPGPGGRDAVEKKMMTESLIENQMKLLASNFGKSDDFAVHLNSDNIPAANRRCTRLNSEQEAS